MNRKTATKLRMINWSRFQNVTVRLEGSTLFTGVNGSGKSTVLDAMMYLLTGSTQFNKAAKDRDRNVIGYVRGDTKSNGKDRFLRSGEVVCYLAMEFFSEIDGETFVIGVCIESQNETDHKSFWFVLPHTEMEDIRFASTENARLIVFPRNQLSVKGKAIKMSTFMGREKALPQVLRAMGLRCEVGKYRGKLLKMLAFNPENNVDKFIRDCVLEPGKVDSLKELREQKAKFEQLKEVYEELRQSKEKLDELEIAMERYEERCRNLYIRQMMFAYQEYVADLQEQEDIAVRLRFQEEKKQSLEQQKIGIDQRMKQAAERLRVAEANDALGDMQKTKEVLEKQISEAEHRMRECETQAAKLLRLKQGLLSLFEELEQEVSAEADEEKIIRILAEPMGDPDQKHRTVIQIADRIQKAKEGLLRESVHIADEVQQLKEQIADLQEQISGLEKNVMRYPKEAEHAREVIRQEFAKQGISSEVRLFAELVKEVKDEKWRPAIETFLGRKRFHIIVDGEYCEEAMRILKQHKLYRATVVITDRLPDVDVEQGSAAEILDIPNVYARRYANYLLNGIHLCASIEELHQYPKGGLMADGMLAKSYAVSLMEMKKGLYYLGSEAIRIQLAQLKKECEEQQKMRTRKEEERIRISGKLKKIEAVDWRIDEYAFDAPNRLEEGKREHRQLSDEKKKLEENPAFMAILQEIDDATKQVEKVTAERDAIVGDISVCLQQIEQERENQKTISGKIFVDKQKYEEERDTHPQLENDMLADYEKRRKKEDSPTVIKYKSVQDAATDVRNAEKSMEDIQIAYNRLAGISTDRRGASFIPFYRKERNLISNVKIEEARQQMDQKSRELESAFMNDFVAEINETIESAQEEIHAINRELKRLPFGSDTYRFMMEEKADRREFFRICRKLDEYGSAEMYQGMQAQDEEFEHDIASFMEIILEEEDEDEYTDYRNYFSYDMKITSVQGDNEVEADLSKKQGSASNGEKQTPYFIILAASLMQCYPMNRCCVRLAFIDEAFSALSRERIEQMVRYFEENHFQVVYAAPPEKIGSIGTYINSTVSLVMTGRYTNMVEGLVKADGNGIDGATEEAARSLAG